jgi:hypothetical protein
LGKAGRSANSLSIGKTRNGLHIGGHDASRAAMRITAPVGEVKLDIAKVTKGLAGSSKENTVIQNSGDTIWSSRDQKQATGPNVAGSGNNGSGSNSGGGSANNSGSGSTNGNGGSNSGNGNGNSGSNNGVNSANKGNGNGNGNGNGHKK